MEGLAVGGDMELPPIIRLNHPCAFDIWLRWRVLERKFLPYAGGFVDQPESIMQDLILLDSIFDKIRDLQNGKSND